MTKDEIIKFEVKEKNLSSCLKEASEYALLSIPFTINRMGIKNLEQRIVNIIKGKLAECLFREFARNYGLDIDLDITSTPYYQTDKRDFIFKGYEWDIKNNYIYCQNFSDEDVLNFLALVPNRNEQDQWNKRNKRFFPKEAPNGVAFLFTFIKRPEDTDIVKVELGDKLKNLLEHYCKIYKGIPQPSEPSGYKEVIMEYINEFSIKPKLDDIELIITGYATKEHFSQFWDLEEGGCFSTSKGEECFRTRIKNKAIKIEDLPSFKSLIEKGAKRDETWKASRPK